MEPITGPDENGTWNRGALQFFYDQAHTFGGSNPDNNGNITQTKHYRPMDDQSATWSISTDQYVYDSLNRLTSVAEYLVTTSQAETQQFQQTFGYDRYGNRTISAGSTWGTGINNKQFDASPTNNRLNVPSGQTGTMSYDAAGNLTTDTYSGFGVTREYDAENRLIKETQSGGYVAGQYTYDAAGHRVKRKVGTTETWQVFGMGGEMVAEYEQVSGISTLRKEYGYRSGQLLVTAEASAQIKWLVADNLGTPRIILDKSGTLANVKRHDYLPFGEELVAGQGLRTTALGYTGDNVRQKFTSKERDIETGLDFFEARYYSNAQGRFTSVDPENYQAMRDPGDPQSWNAYAYVNNNPLGRIDPDGRGFWDKLKNAFRYGHFVENDELAKLEQERREWLNQHYYERDAQGSWRPFDSSQLSTQDVFDKYREVKFLYDEKQLHPLTNEEIIQAWSNVANSSQPTRRVIGKTADLNKPGALKQGESTLDLPNKGTPKANWQQNSSRLREAMREGRPIRDASVNPNTGALRDNTGFLRAERNLLRSNGWKYDRGTKMWHPPGK